MKFRICYTSVENSIEAKGVSGVDVSAFKHGETIENREFVIPDKNGDRTLLQAWRRECRMLNILRPTLHHWVDTHVND